MRALTRWQELTPARVKHLLESVIRSHLGWLVVWGNIFGGCIGMGIGEWGVDEISG